MLCPGLQEIRTIGESDEGAIPVHPAVLKVVEPMRIEKFSGQRVHRAASGKVEFRDVKVHGLDSLVSGSFPDLIRKFANVITQRNRAENGILRVGSALTHSFFKVVI